MSQTFRRSVRIRFSHCDAAGIVFHPNYFVLLNDHMEDFWRECAGFGMGSMLTSGIGFPVAGVQVDFSAPSRIGDVCVFELGIARLGTSSVTFAVRVFDEKTGEVRLRGTETVVCVRAGNAGMQSTPIPLTLREKLEPYVSAIESAAKRA